MSVNHKELSEQIANLYNTNEQTWVLDDSQDYAPRADLKYITQDIGEMMRLAIENFMYIGVAYCEFYNNDGQVFEVTERVELHDNDPVLATCVAIAKALIKLKDNQP